MTRDHYIWDGLNYRTVPPDEAKRLVAEDKAQDLTSRFVSGTELKTRAQFTGYHRAAPPKAEDEVPSGKPDPEPLKHWLSYRALAAKDLKKPANKITKAEVDEWLIEKGHAVAE